VGIDCSIQVSTSLLKISAHRSFHRSFARFFICGKLFENKFCFQVQRLLAPNIRYQARRNARERLNNNNNNNPPAPKGHTAVKIVLLIMLSTVLSSCYLVSVSVVCPMPSVFRRVLCPVLCPLSSVLCPLFSVFYPPFSVLCPLSSVAEAGFWYLIEAVRGLGGVRSPPKTWLP
jgi:hypothetical protein